MYSDKVISNGQGALLFLNFLWASTFLIIPGILAAKALTDAWLVPLLIIPFSIMNYWILWKLLSLFPGQTIAAICQKLLGPWLGGVLGGAYAWFALMLASLVLRNFGDFMGLNFLPETPREVLHLALLALVVWAAYEGIETIARVNQIFMGVVFFLIIAGTAFTLQDFKGENLLPVAARGWQPVAAALLSIWGFPFAEVVAVSFVFCHLRDLPGFSPLLAKMAAGAACGLLLVTVIALGTFGADFTGKMTYPALQLDKYTYIGGFLGRTEILSMSFLLLSGFIKITLCFKGALVYIRDLAGLPSYKPLLWPLAAIVFALSFLLYRDIIHQMTFAGSVWPYYSITMGFIIPLFLLLWARLSSL